MKRRSLESMWRWTRLLCAVVLFALATGSVLQAAQTAGTDLQMALAGSDGPETPACDGCCGDDTGSAKCNMDCTVHLLGLVPSDGFAPIALSAALYPWPGLNLAGQSRPPDPHPPRPSILS